MSAHNPWESQYIIQYGAISFRIRTRLRSILNVPGIQKFIESISDLQ